jgi:hypothetical protein
MQSYLKEKLTFVWIFETELAITEENGRHLQTPNIHCLRRFIFVQAIF